MAFHVYPNAPSQRSFQVCRQRMDESPFTPGLGTLVCGLESPLPSTSKTLAKLLEARAA
jgi:hypothetical protein